MKIRVNDDNAVRKTFKVLVRDEVSRNPNVPWAQRQERIFVLNREKFCQRSRFLREALEQAESNSSNPDTPKPFILKNHMPDDFAAYQRCVYTQTLDMPVDDDDDPLFPLLRLYVLADQLCDYTITNRIINEIVRFSDEWEYTPSKKEIWYVWEFVETYDHPLRKLFIDYQIHRAPRDSLVFQESEHISFDYLSDVALKFWDLAEQSRELAEAEGEDAIFGVKCSERPKCHYHQHGMDRNHVSCEELDL